MRRFRSDTAGSSGNAAVADKKRILAISGAGVGALALVFLLVRLLFGGSQPHAELDRWTGQREHDLEAVAKRLMDYAAANGNKFPKDAKELAAAGIMTPEQARFRDPTRNVEVLRQYRPGNAPKDGNRIIMILENYEPNPDNQLMVVYSDGQIGVRVDLQSTISDDNGLRRWLKTKEIPWSPPEP